MMKRNTADTSSSVARRNPSGYTIRIKENVINKEWEITS